MKLIEAGFIREEKYVDWISNIFLVKKKNGQICICINFWISIRHAQKNNFLLQVSKLLVDMFSFTKGSLGFNQIKMTTEDEKHISFRIFIGIFYYTVMPFGLRNPSATYQWVITHVFDELIHQKAKCYVPNTEEINHPTLKKIGGKFVSNWGGCLYYREGASRRSLSVI
ncbi:hypothetical protein KFK09_018618 [Dendrobium nobile]|uniref:Uncharacterized protein n=1 Tax=Dendrobium nobile TaxID=94219 RepID=A0A8T3AUV4_DENNO|nr:hypothetical protein KFK09_018618 [Dendrobium nobile]